MGSTDQILVVVSDSIGRRWFHRSRWRTLTVGRADACELMLGSSRVSRRHLHISIRGDGLLVTDLGSAGGTFVNGLRIEGRVDVDSGAVIEAGPFLLEVFLDADPPEEAQPWPHLGGTAAPALPDRTPLSDEEEAINYRALIRWAQVAHLPYKFAVTLGVRLLEEVQRHHARGQLLQVVPPEWIWIGKTGAVAVRPEVPPEMAASGNFDSYGSPELFDRPDADVRSDIFACGLVVYELICARHPFQGASKKLGSLPLRGPFPDLRLSRQAVGREVAHVVQTALEACPDDRFASVPGFIGELSRAFEEDTGESLDEDPSPTLKTYFDKPAPAGSSPDEGVDDNSDAPVVLKIEVTDPGGDAEGEVTQMSFPGTGEVTIGRHHTNDLVLLSLRLSRRHARFFFDEGSIMLEDLGSANGTYVNGQKVRRPTPVAVGDRIEMGGLRLKLGLEAARGPHLFIILQQAGSSPKRVAFHGRAKINIGSDPDAEFHLLGEGVAPRHARFIVWGDRLQIEDLAGGQPTLVGGARVSGTRLLSSTDSIQIGPWRVNAALDEWPDATVVHASPSRPLLPSEGAQLDGFGGPGTVTQAERTSSSIPIFRTRAPKGPHGPDEELFMRGIKELRSVRSPYLFPVVGGGLDDEGYFVDRPCLPGSHLGAHGDSSLPLEVALTVGEALLEGMQAFSSGKLHKLGVSNLRPQVSPAAVFLRADGRVLWLGCTLRAQMPPEDMSDESGQELAWIAPESSVDPAAPTTDHELMFGLGAVLFRLLTGAGPFDRAHYLDTMRAVASEPPTDPVSLAPEIDPALVTYLMRLLEKDPLDRFASIDRALVELRAVRDAAVPKAGPRLLTVREWLKRSDLARTGSEEGQGWDEATSELDLTGVTDEGGGEG